MTDSAGLDGPDNLDSGSIGQGGLADPLPSRILLLIADAGDRRKLKDWLDKQSEFEPVGPEKPLDETEVDICILDKGGFRENVDELRAKKAATGPGLLPFLLLLPDTESNIIETDSGRLADNVITETIDEILTRPFKLSVLKWRLQALIRLRRQSLSFHNYERELERVRDITAFALRATDAYVFEIDFESGEERRYGDWKAVHGISSDEVPTTSAFIEQAVHPDDRQEVQAIYDDIDLIPGASARFDYRTNPEHGDVTWVRAKLEIKADQTGESLRGIGMATNISELQERTRELERYERVVESASDVMWMFRDDFSELLFINSQYEDVFGQPTAALRDDPLAFIEAVHPDDRELVSERIERISNGEAVDFEIRVNRRENFHRWVWIKGEPIFDGEEQIAVSGLSRDITQRKVLEQRHRRIHRAVEASGHAIYITDTDGTIEYVNPAFETVTGYSADEAVGENPRLLKSGQMPDSYYEDLWATVQAGDIWEEVVINRRKNDELYHAHQTIAPVTDPTGEIEAYVAIQTDITERKRLEENRQESIQQLQVLDRVLRHNLRNEMNVVKGYAETIQSEADCNAVDDAEKIVQTSNGLLDTVEKERRITKLLSQDHSLKAIDFGEILDAAVADARERYPAAEFTVNRPDDIMVQGIGSLSEAFDELLMNAIKHSDQETPTIEIDVSLQDDSVEVRLADDGPGIPEIEYHVLTDEAEIDALFHASGLGLWLVYLIVQKSNGSVRFEENEPRGSVVTVELPLVSQQASESAMNS